MQSCTIISKIERLAAASTRRNFPGVDAGAKLAAVLIVVSFLPGCGHAPVEDSQPKQARSEVERGPVRVSVEVQPARARLSDQPTMTLTIDCEPGVSVEKPVFADSIGDFRIHDVQEPLPQVKNQREITQQIFTLEPTRTGELPIFPIAVRFTDTRPEGDGKQHIVETEEFTVDIVSVVDSEVTSLDELRSQSPPIALPRPARVLLWSLTAAVVAIAGVVLAWWLRKRHRKTVEQRRLSAKEIAQLELQKLWESGLAERDVKLYYVDVTGIVRRYIERTTAVRAPEQTTEEFLREISRRNTFPPEEGRRLKNFLESADLVKFAAHQPRAEDIHESFQRAKDFVGFEPSY